VTDPPDAEPSGDVGRGASAGPSPEGAARRAGGRRIRGLAPEQRRQERRRQLLGSAIELFGTQGYSATSIEQICQNAFVGFKGFYDEFATKEQLFIEVYRLIMRDVKGAISAEIEATPGHLPTSRRLFEVFVDAAVSDPRRAHIAYVEAAGLSPDVEALRRQAHQDLADFLEQLYGADGSSMDGRTSHRIALGLVGAIGEIMVDWLAAEGGDREQLVADLDSYCQVVLAGVATLVG
jgi:AcrR family transcriptional regulator